MASRSNQVLPIIEGPKNDKDKNEATTAPENQISYSREGIYAPPKPNLSSVNLERIASGLSIASGASGPLGKRYMEKRKMRMVLLMRAYERDSAARAKFIEKFQEFQTYTPQEDLSRRGPDK